MANVKIFVQGNGNEVGQFLVDVFGSDEYLKIEDVWSCKYDLNNFEEIENLVAANHEGHVKIFAAHQLQNKDFTDSTRAVDTMADVKKEMVMSIYLSNTFEFPNGADDIYDYIDVNQYCEAELDEIITNPSNGINNAVKYVDSQGE